MTVTPQVPKAHKAFVYAWVTVINFVLIFGVWFASPWGVRAMRTKSAGIVPTVPVNTSFLPPSAIVGTPVHLNLSTLSIDLNVLPGEYNPDDQSWTLSGTNAHFANVSMPINSSTGNTLIYGHNNKHVFYNLRKITAGTKLSVQTDNGYTFTYTYVKQTNVDPTDTSVFRTTGLPTVTIQTCTGNWNESRGMYEFKLSGVAKTV